MKYSVGLDIGNSSVGWAVINPKTYQILRAKAKMLSVYVYLILHKLPKNDVVTEQQDDGYHGEDGDYVC